MRWTAQQAWWMIQFLRVRVFLSRIKFLNTKLQSVGKHRDAGKDCGQEEKGTTENKMVDGITEATDMSLSKPWEIGKDREAWCAAAHGVTNSWTPLSHWTTTTIILSRRPKKTVLKSQQRSNKFSVIRSWESQIFQVGKKNGRGIASGLTYIHWPCSRSGICLVLVMVLLFVAKGWCKRWFVVVLQSLSQVWLFEIPWTAARQASCPLSPRVCSNSCPLSWWYNHLILCRPLLLPPSIFPSISVFIISQLFT